MKSLLPILLIIFISCFGESPEEKFFKTCPYKKDYAVPAHQLQVPINIVPHKLTYKVGDTITIVVNMTDSVYDANTEQKFKISNFPFETLPVLYHFYDDVKWKDGWRSVKYDLSSNQFVRYIEDGNRADGLVVKINNENGYNLDLKMVLKEKGRYILQVQDLINDSSDENYERIKAIQFDGKCPTFSYMPIQTIVGDDNMSHFEKELLHIDKEEFYDNWRSIKTKNLLDNPYGNGYFTFEHNATFGFIVE